MHLRSSQHALICLYIDVGYELSVWHFMSVSSQLICLYIDVGHELSVWYFMSVSSQLICLYILVDCELSVWHFVSVSPQTLCVALFMDNCSPEANFHRTEITINSESALNQSSFSNKKTGYHQSLLVPRIFLSLRNVKLLRGYLIMFQKFKDIIHSEMDADGPAGK